MCNCKTNSAAVIAAAKPLTLQGRITFVGMEVPDIGGCVNGCPMPQFEGSMHAALPNTLAGRSVHWQSTPWGGETLTGWVAV